MSLKLAVTANLEIALVIALTIALGGCARPRPGVPPDIGQHEWSISRARLAQLRAGEAVRPYTERVRVDIHDPVTGKDYHARGAVAVSPRQAARLMLVGPGGTTALDLWVTKDRYRFSVPAIHLEKRGGVEVAEASLPVGMLRWWFLSPLAGRLLAGRSSQHESTWVLRDDSATVLVRTDGKGLAAVRRDHDRVESIEWIGRGIEPRAGSRGRYIEARYGLKVDVVVEEVMAAEPDPEAFDDPDAPSEKGTNL